MDIIKNNEHFDKAIKDIASIIHDDYVEYIRMYKICVEDIDAVEFSKEQEQCIARDFRVLSEYLLKVQHTQRHQIEKEQEVEDNVEQLINYIARHANINDPESLKDIFITIFYYSRYAYLVEDQDCDNYENYLARQYYHSYSSIKEYFSEDIIKYRDKLIK